ncbi:hypothetical protein L7F22_049269 [Adiantum nelumboides]|nr:hypothetical protein [Adiantum nelumboides]
MEESILDSLVCNENNALCCTDNDDDAVGNSAEVICNKDKALHTTINDDENFVETFVVNKRQARELESLISKGLSCVEVENMLATQIPLHIEGNKKHLGKMEVDVVSSVLCKDANGRIARDIDGHVLSNKGGQSLLEERQCEICNSALCDIKVIGWVLFNILKHAWNHLNRMKSLKALVRVLGLGAMSMLLASHAKAIEEIATLAVDNDSRGVLLLVVLLLAIGWVLFNILQLALKQTVATTCI